MLDKMRARNHIYYLILNASQTKNDAKEKERWRTRHTECGFQSVAHLLRTFFFVFFCCCIVCELLAWIVSGSPWAYQSVSYISLFANCVLLVMLSLSLSLVLNERKMFAHNFICSIQWKYFWAIKKKRNPS